MSGAPGTLFVVATPIGNLEDFTFRGVRTLREVDLIAAEDTRRTAKLLAHYEIQKPVVSLHAHNEARETARLVGRLQGGASIALVSDAGTPTIADPGAELIKAARQAGIQIVPIPGPSAITSVLSAAGVPADQFLFLGFPPASGSERRRWLEDLGMSPRTTVFYEAPHRIDRTLNEVAQICIKRPIIIGRELTKTNEELVEWNKKSPIRQQGEFVLVIGPRDIDPTTLPEASNVAILFGQIAEHTALGEDAILTMLAAHWQATVVRIRNLLKKGRIELKRSADNRESAS